MKIYEDKTRVMSWGKALAIGFSMTAIAYGLTAWSLHSLLLDRVYLYAACFLFVSYFVRNKTAAPERQCYIHMYDDYFTCKGLYGSLQRGKKPRYVKEGEQFSYADVSFIHRNQINLIVDVDDIRVMLLSMENAKETEERLKAKVREYSS